MQELEPVTEHEVVLTFLRGEIDSPLYGIKYQTELTSLGSSRKDLIDHADLTDPCQNDLRKKLLRSVRGYPDQFLFLNFPQDVTWRRVRVETNEIAALRNGRFDNWIELTKGSRSVARGAAEIASGLAERSPNANIRTIAAEVKDVAEKVRKGQKFTELIVVQATAGELILLEGNTRATAYVFVEIAEPIEIIVGSSSRMKVWHWY